MPRKGRALTINYFAFDASNTGGTTGEGVNGDVANHSIRIIKDGAAPAVPTNSPTEPHSTQMPGIYELALTADEMDADFIAIHGTSSTADVQIKPTFIPTDGGVVDDIFDETASDHSTSGSIGHAIQIAKTRSEGELTLLGQIDASDDDDNTTDDRVAVVAAGTQRTIALDVLKDGELFDLTQGDAGDPSEISIEFSGSSSNVTKTLTAGDVSERDYSRGEISVTLSATDTGNLTVARRQDFVATITLQDGTDRVARFNDALTVESGSP